MASEFGPESDKGGTKSVGQAKSVFSEIKGLSTSTNLFTEAAATASKAVASATASTKERNLNPFGDF